MTDLDHLSIAIPDESLDPRDWTELTNLGHQMLDDMMYHLSTLHSQPAWQQMPDSVKLAISDEALPIEPQGAANAYRDFLYNVLPYPNGNLHPRFFGWVQGNGTPLGMLADMLASGMNAHLAGFNQAPALVEHRVLDWMRQLIGMPIGTSGVLATGGTMANILGLAVGRHVKAGFDIREEGLQCSDRPRLIAYCSTETHGWAQKGVEVLGLGNRHLRRIPADDEFRMDVAALLRAAEADRREGHRPFCVIATAGTVNTGAIDDLNGIADFCAAHDLWFHIDGAFGALAKLAPSLQALVAGVDRADSIAFDLHKWMYLPFEIACVLVRDGKAHRDAFALSPSYLAETTRGVSAGGLPFADRGIDLTRGFKALKAWMSIKAHGIAAFGRLIDQNVRQAQHFAQLVDAHPKLERLAPAPLNIVCFRYSRPAMSEESLDAFNRELLLRLQESGAAVPSGTLIRERYALRVCIVNHRTRTSDLDELVKTIARVGDTLAAV